MVNFVKDHNYVHSYRRDCGIKLLHEEASTHLANHFGLIMEDLVLKEKIRQIAGLSLALSLIASGCLEKPSLKDNRTPNPAPAEDPSLVLLATQDISLNPSDLRSTLEKIFASNSDCPATPDVSGMRQLRLLTRDEYNRTVKDLFSLSGDYRAQLPLEQKVLGFRNNSQFALVSSDHASAYDKTAQDIAEELLTDHWMRLMNCPVRAGISCAEQFVRSYAPRIWRRPLSEAEIQNTLQLHRVGSEISPELAMQLVIRGLLTSPHFLYRSELGQDGKLTAFEMASGLSYFFWGTGPDEELFKAAASGALSQETNVIAQAERLMQDTRARVGIDAFADAWLGYTAVLSVNKDFSKFPQFDFRVRSALARETEDFFNHIVLDKKGRFEELFLADYSLGGQDLANFYQAEMVQEGSLQKLKFPNQKRQGLLGHGSLLSSLAYATETGPIQRGKFVREHLLCDILIPPPPDLMIKPPAPKEGATTRERFAAHTSVQPCKGCHVKIDGVGFSMEDFDAIGLYRDLDNGKAVDATGQVYALDGKNSDVNGAAELSSVIGQSTRARQCFVVQTWRMIQGRLESKEDVCALRQLTKDFSSQNLSMAQLLIKLITDPSFSQRSR